MLFHAVIYGMDTMELRNRQESYGKLLIKGMTLIVVLAVLMPGIKSVHEDYLNSLTINSDFLNKKSFLITQMHQEMLSITRTQYEILHASNHGQVRQLLLSLSNGVSDYLGHYHQFEEIYGSTDTEILNQFNTSFRRWYSFNKDLLYYANVVSDADFINTLNKIDLAFGQFDTDPNEALLLIAGLRKDVNSYKGL